jgi:hypothetical protein
MIINRSAFPVLISISDTFKRISKLDKYLFLVCDLLAAADIDLRRGLN